MNKYIIIGLIILALMGTVFLQYKVIESKNKEIAKQEVALEIQSDSINKLESKRKEDQTAINDLYLLNKTSELESQNVKKMLERAKDHRKAVLGRPTLVEKMANRATVKVFNEIECITGNCK